VTLITCFAAFILNLVVVGMVFPHGFPLVGPAILLLFSWTVIQMLLTDGKVYYDAELLCVYLALFGFLLLGVGLSPELYPVVRREVVNAIAGLMFIPVLWRIAACNRFDQFRQAFAVSLVLFMTCVALVSLYKFRLNLQGIRLSGLVSVEAGESYPLGAALQGDYNMSALGLTAGMVACGYLFVRTDRMFRRWLLAAAIMIMLLAALLMGSRRFYAIFAVVLLAALLYGSWRALRGGAMLLRRVSAGRRVVVHTALAALLLGAIAFAVGPRALDLAGALTGGQMDRLLARLQTLMQFSATLEQSRGPHLDLAFNRLDSYSLPQFLVGSGFSYLTGMRDGGAESYPHNPVVAALLYGGVLNMLLVVFVLGRATVLYGGRLRSEPLFSALFFVTLAFMMISGNTVFSNQLLVMLLIIGFVLRSRPLTVGGAAAWRDG
jgi:hypothetical protein